MNKQAAATTGLIIDYGAVGLGVDVYVFSQSDEKAAT